MQQQRPGLPTQTLPAQPQGPLQTRAPLREPIVRVAIGSRALLVLGRSQRGLPVDETVLPVVRRASGGGAVLAGPWLLRATVSLPPRHRLTQGGIVAAARWFGDVHLRWLRAHGIDAAELYDGPSTDHWACFAGRGPGEIVVDGRKIAGIAQRWGAARITLSGGTLLTPPPWQLLVRALRRADEETAELDSSAISAQQCLRQPVRAAAWAASLRELLIAGVG